LNRREVASGTALASRPSPRDGENGQTWIQYTVEAGDALATIAREYGVSVNDLKRWNGLRGEKIVVGQRLEIFSEPEEKTRIIPTEKRSPMSAPSTAAQGSPPNDERTHRVKKGETLSKIAKSYGITVNELMKHNKLTSSKIKINQTLKIPTSSGSTSSNVQYHEVRSGDSLWKISRMYGVSIEDLQANNDVSDVLHPGVKLVIPSH